MVTYRRELVIFNSTLLKTLGIIDRTLVADVDNGFDLSLPIAYENSRGMGVVDFPECFHCTEDPSNWFGDRSDGLPFCEVLDVPFAFCREVLKLPAER